MKDYTLIQKAHEALIKSARKSKNDGLLREQWEQSEIIINFIKNNNLHQDIAKHISMFVWTFKR